MLNWPLALSKTLAAETAIVNNFIWNDLWTFHDLSVQMTGWRDRARRFGAFNLVCLAGIALNIAFLTLQVRVLEMNVYVANFIAIFLVSVWNFTMNLRYGWGETKWNRPGRGA
jgi:dolichol-phosphate mannosyltransferase